MNESKGQQSMEEELLFANKGLRTNSLALLIIPCVTLCRLIHASEFQGLFYQQNRHLSDRDQIDRFIEKVWRWLIYTNGGPNDSAWARAKWCLMSLL